MSNNNCIKDIVKKKNLGRGAYGEVHLINENNNIYILKTINKLKSYNLELKNLNRIKKKIGNKCQEYFICYEKSCIYKDIGYIYTNYIKDTFPLKEAIKEIDIEDKYMIIEDLLKGLDILHNDVKMAHNDIKPDNILITPNDNKSLIKYIDFGSACNNSCQIIGTIKYVSPILIKALGSNTKETIDKQKRGDIWSLGIVICEILNNEHPINIGEMQYIFNSQNIKNIFISYPEVLNKLKKNKVNSKIIKILEEMLNIKSKNNIKKYVLMFENMKNNQKLKKGKSIALLKNKSSSSQLLKAVSFEY